MKILFGIGLVLLLIVLAAAACGAFDKYIPRDPFDE
jgi:hypothetical protein